MIVAALVVAGLAASGIAFALPYLPKRAAEAAPVPASVRSWWVNRLFALASQADASGERQLAAAARALIDALVNPSQQASKRG